MDPMLALKVAVLGCALVLQPILLFASPFTRAERLLIATSEFVLFEYLTVSRSLSLGAALLVVSMFLWRRRSFWIAVALLPMCDFLFGVLSAAFVAMRWREGSLWWPGMVLWFAFALAAAWTVLPAPDIQPALQSTHPLLELGYWCLAMSDLAFPFQGMTWPRWNAPPNLAVAIWAWLVFLKLAWLQTAEDTLYRWLLTGFVALTLVFALFIYRLSPRHLMLVALFFILLVWRLKEAGKLPRAGFQIWLFVASLCGLATAAINLVVPFDTSTQAAATIRSLGLQRKHWIVFPDDYGSGISALDHMYFERVELHCMQSFVRWNYRHHISSRGALEAYLSSEVDKHGKLYLLTSLDLNDLNSVILAPIAHIPAGYDGRSYHLYVVGPHAAERPLALHPCVRDQRPLSRLGTANWALNAD